MPVLETFPQTIVDLGFAHLPPHALHKFEELYAGMPPQNFIWYLSRLHVAAKRLYDADGVQVLPRLWKLLLQSSDEWPDSQLAERLRAEVHPEVERVLMAWPA